MKHLRVFFKALFFTALFLDAVIFSAIIYVSCDIGESYKIKKGEDLGIDTAVPITAEYEGVVLSQSSATEKIGNSFEVKLKAFGIIPVTTVGVEVVDELYVSVLGTPFGMKLYTDGVLVIDITAVETENGSVSPAKSAGIKRGDYIVSVDGKSVFTNEELSAAVESSGGNRLCLVIKRNGVKKSIYLTAALSKENGAYKLGLWVRDSTAGIGTLTFYSPSTGVAGGLGHGVCDEDTGELLQLNSGELVSAEIISVEKGKAGAPGQLKGKFTATTIGKIDCNAETGVFSFLRGKLGFSQLVQIALKQEVKDGEAKLCCTVKGDTPALYDCRIKKRSAGYLAQTQNMTVTVTDKELLELTGGIVQGMSGSPILQDGKLVGAVTHVLVDDPSSGYAVFAENMLKTAQNIQSNTLKEAS